MADGADRIIAQLYRVPPSAFTRERNARATALEKAGEPAQAHAVRQLRRPSASLWATNQLAPDDPKRLATFFETVEEVRRTQLRDPRGAGEAMRRHRGELDARVTRLRRAGRHPGRPSPQARVPWSVRPVVPSPWWELRRCYDEPPDRQRTGG
jgi:hypothetical protein